MPVTDALLIVFALFVWIEGGRAHFRLMEGADRIANPHLEDAQEFRA